MVQSLQCMVLAFASPLIFGWMMMDGANSWVLFQDEILHLLSASEGDVLEDDTLVSTWLCKPPKLWTIFNQCQIGCRSLLCRDLNPRSTKWLPPSKSLWRLAKNRRCTCNIFHHVRLLQHPRVRRIETCVCACARNMFERVQDWRCPFCQWNDQLTWSWTQATVVLQETSTSE